jgi:hypothetical protein
MVTRSGYPLLVEAMPVTTELLPCSFATAGGLLCRPIGDARSRRGHIVVIASA